MRHSVPHGQAQHEAAGSLRVCEGTVPAEHPGVSSGPAGGFGDVPAAWGHQHHVPEALSFKEDGMELNGQGGCVVCQLP